MQKIQKIILILLAVPILLLSFNVRPVLAADNSVLIVQLEQEIQNLIKQIIAIFSQSIQQKIAAVNNLRARSHEMTVDTYSRNQQKQHS